MYQKNMNFIFGVGSNGFSFLMSTKMKIDYFVDNHRTLWGKKFNSIKCISPAELKNKKINKIVIATPAIENVEAQLEELKIDKSKIIISPELETDRNYLPKKNFLISVPGKNGGIYKLNPFKNKLRKVFKGSVRGIVKTKENYTCVDENEGVIILDKKFKIIKKKKLNYMSNPHSIDFDEKNNIIYLAITAFDCVYKISYPSLKIIKKIFIFKESSYDKHHINGLKYNNDNLYLSMFSKKGIFRKDIWNDGSIFKYNLKTNKKKLIKDKLFQPHSIQLDGKSIHACNSMKFEVLINLKKKIQFNGYARGLLIEKDYIIVGMSRVRRLNRFKFLKKFISQDTGVIFLDRKRNTSNFFRTPSTEIYDIINC